MHWQRDAGSVLASWRGGWPAAVADGGMTKRLQCPHARRRSRMNSSNTPQRRGAGRRPGRAARLVVPPDAPPSPSSTTIWRTSTRGLAPRGLTLCVMRERTPLPRAMLERLPRLKLIVSTGARTPPSTWPRLPSDIAKSTLATLSRHHRDDLGAGPGQPPIVAENRALAAAAGSRHRRRPGGKSWAYPGACMAPVATGALLGMQVLAWSPHMTPERPPKAARRRSP